MTIKNLQTECKLEFYNSQLNFEDLGCELERAYPGEYLSLNNLDQIDENFFIYKEFVPLVNRGAKSFIAFEFIKLVCEERFGFKFKSVIVCQRNKYAKQYDYKEEFLNTTSSYYEEFLKEWAIATNQPYKHSKKTIGLKFSDYTLEAIARIIAHYAHSTSSHPDTLILPQTIGSVNIIIEK